MKLSQNVRHHVFSWDTVYIYMCVFETQCIYIYIQLQYIQYIQYIKLYICVYFSWHNGAKVWNGLPSDVTSASSLAVFKNRLKTYLLILPLLWNCLTLNGISYSSSLRPLQYSGRCNSFNCLGHFKHHDDDDDDGWWYWYNVKLAIRRSCVHVFNSWPDTDVWKPQPSYSQLFIFIYLLTYL